MPKYKASKILKAIRRRVYKKKKKLTKKTVTKIAKRVMTRGVEKVIFDIAANTDWIQFNQSAIEYGGLTNWHGVNLFPRFAARIDVSERWHEKVFPVNGIYTSKNQTWPFDQVTYNPGIQMVVGNKIKLVAMQLKLVFFNTCYYGNGVSGFAYHHFIGKTGTQAAPYALSMVNGVLTPIVRVLIVSVKKGLIDKDTCLNFFNSNVGATTFIPPNLFTVHYDKFMSVQTVRSMRINLSKKLRRNFQFYDTPNATWASQYPDTGVYLFIGSSVGVVTNVDDGGNVYSTARATIRCRSWYNDT